MFISVCVCSVFACMYIRTLQSAYALPSSTGFIPLYPKSFYSDSRVLKSMSIIERYCKDHFFRSLPMDKRQKEISTTPIVRVILKSQL